MPSVTNKDAGAVGITDLWSLSAAMSGTWADTPSGETESIGMPCPDCGVSNNTRLVGVRDLGRDWDESANLLVDGSDAESCCAAGTNGWVGEILSSPG